MALLTHLGQNGFKICLSGLFIIGCPAAILLVMFFEVGYSLLTYAVLILVGASGAYGCRLYYILHKLDKSKNEYKNIGKITGGSQNQVHPAIAPVEPLSIPVSPKKTSPISTTISERNSGTTRKQSDPRFQPSANGDVHIDIHS